MRTSLTTSHQRATTNLTQYRQRRVDTTDNESMYQLVQIMYSDTRDATRLETTRLLPPPQPDDEEHPGSMPLTFNDQHAPRLNRFARGNLASQQARSGRLALTPGQASSRRGLGDARWRERSMATVRARGSAIRNYWKPSFHIEEVGLRSRD